MHLEARRLVCLGSIHRLCTALLQKLLLGVDSILRQGVHSVQVCCIMVRREAPWTVVQAIDGHVENNGNERRRDEERCVDKLLDAQQANHDNMLHVDTEHDVVDKLGPDLASRLVKTTENIHLLVCLNAVIDHEVKQHKRAHERVDAAVDNAKEDRNGMVGNDGAKVLELLLPDASTGLRAWCDVGEDGKHDELANAQSLERLGNQRACCDIDDEEGADLRDGRAQDADDLPRIVDPCCDLVKEGSCKNRSEEHDDRLEDEEARHHAHVCLTLRNGATDQHQKAQQKRHHSNEDDQSKTREDSLQQLRNDRRVKSRQRSSTRVDQALHRCNRDHEEEGAQPEQHPHQAPHSRAYCCRHPKVAPDQLPWLGGILHQPVAGVMVVQANGCSSLLLAILERDEC
mmetsp:Transcript_20399/g.60687  ORF Transcript_20399/g.60687 Transcript_20399/m.60687 type:complete len:401 (-) Transcript_20399:1508-2710(-)